VCLERTNGNPFFLRQMLEVCHQKGCIWYTWKQSAWEFDLDRLFCEFESESHGLDHDFLTKRLRDLPQSARSILAWASLLGSTFSFGFLQRLLIGECRDTDESIDEACRAAGTVLGKNASANTVQGLNACLQALVLVPDSDDDHFSFAHDRYVQASGSLRECHDVENMHFLIARTMMKYTNSGDLSFYARARHIREASRLIKRVIKQRREYRQILLQAARRATDSGSRSTALQQLQTCLSLLQPNPWIDGQDVDYAETLECYSQAADLYWHEGQLPEAQQLINAIFTGARSASDRTSAWILQSRILSRQGKLAAVFDALKTSLAELGLVFQTPTEEICDEEYLALRKLLRENSGSDLSQKPTHSGSQTRALGQVLCEAISAALWNDSLVCFPIEAGSSTLTCITVLPNVYYIFCQVLRNTLGSSE